VDNKVNPRTYLGKFYVDSLVHSKEALTYLINVLGSNSVILGSDYPFPLGEHNPGNTISTNPDIDDKMKSNLFNKNALNWLGLETL
jgi:aminocarboxymuconate-semialdehyde decarboxylase